MTRYVHFLHLTIPIYGLMMCVGFFLTSFFAVKRAKTLGISPDDMLGVAAVTIGTALLSGGVFYYFVTYGVERIVTFILNGDFSFLSNVGIIFYGGLIGGILGAVAAMRLFRIKAEILEKAAVPFLPLGHAVGRIGCLFAGCCYGIEYDGILAVKNIYAHNPSATYFPVQAVEALCNVGIMLVLLAMSKKEHRKYGLLCAYLEMYAAVRFVLEFLRGDAIRGVHARLSTSQWISICLMIACVTYRITGIVRKKTTDKKGV